MADSEEIRYWRRRGFQPMWRVVTDEGWRDFADQRAAWTFLEDEGCKPGSQVKVFRVAHKIQSPVEGPSHA